MLRLAGPTTPVRFRLNPNSTPGGASGRLRDEAARKGGTGGFPRELLSILLLLLVCLCAVTVLKPDGDCDVWARPAVGKLIVESGEVTRPQGTPAWRRSSIPTASSTGRSVPFNFGSYASWRLYPACRVAVDGRYETVYLDSTFRAVDSNMAKRSDWSVAYEDARYRVYVRAAEQRDWPPLSAHGEEDPFSTADKPRFAP